MRIHDEEIEEYIAILTDAARDAFYDITYATAFQVKDNKDENLHRADKYADALHSAIEDFMYSLAEEIRQGGDNVEKE